MTDQKNLPAVITPLPWERTDKGKKLAKKSFPNAFNTLIELGLSFSHDTFHDRKYVNSHELDDAICRVLRELVIRRRHVDPGIENIRQAAERLCESVQYDPVVNYLNGLQWDTQPRIDTWLINYMGAEDTPLNREISRRALIAAVRRARHPSAKFDEIIVLEGPEGKGKSRAIEILAGADNFSDQKLLGASERELQENLKGVWLYEIADLSGMKRAEVEEVKAFASRVTDRGRPAYGRFVVRQPRRCVIFATTNDDVYLKSQTGNRRFEPVRTGQINLERLKKERDQLWAEAAYRESQDESIALPERLWEAARIEQEERLIEDPFEDRLRDVVGIIGKDKNGNDEERITTEDLLTRVGIPKEQQRAVDAQRIAGVMKRLGWTHKHSIKFSEQVRGPNGPETWAYVRAGYVRPACSGDGSAKGRPLQVLQGGKPQKL